MKTKLTEVVEKLSRPLGPFRGEMYTGGGLMGNVFDTFKKKYARLLVEQGDYDMATKVMLDGGLPTVADDPEAHVVLASLYQRLGEPFLAAQTYRNLLVVWPQTGAFWVGLGGSLEGQHLSVAAVECYQKALKTKNLRKDLAAYAKKRLSVLN